MSHPYHPSRRLAALLLVIATAGLTLGASIRRHDDPPRSGAACATPAFRQFDFFAGDWDTFDMADPGKVVARNRVTLALGGCAVREVYEQADGMVGESLSLYDASRRRWHQSWVTNRGSLLLLNGGLEAERKDLVAGIRHRVPAASVARLPWRVSDRCRPSCSRRSAAPRWPPAAAPR